MKLKSTQKSAINPVSLTLVQLKSRQNQLLVVDVRSGLVHNLQGVTTTWQQAGYPLQRGSQP
jgi:rhodanese-related sulfurtransferase